MQHLLTILLSISISLTTSCNNKNSNKKNTKKVEESKTITFHPPESDAEKALDNILRIENGLMPNCKVDGNPACPRCIKEKVKGLYFALSCQDYHRNNFLTKEFLLDEMSQQAEYRNQVNQNERYISEFSSLNHITGVEDILSLVGFRYFTVEISDDIVYIYISPIGWEDLISGNESGDRYIVNLDNMRYKLSYAMKQENGIWKLDGVCLWHTRINHKKCFVRFHHDIQSP
jgi:hypothetical protein